jgi:hypothetical protein
MNSSQKILFNTLIKPFYKQNAAFFIFILVIMIGVVGELDGSDMIDYHYALILGMLNNLAIFILVLLLWLLYAIKCARFLTASIQKKEYSFLAILTGFDTRKNYLQLFFTQLFIYLPVLLYSLIIIGVAFYNKRSFEGVILIVFDFIVCIASASWYVHVLKNQGKNFSTFNDKIFNLNIGTKNYGGMLLRYIFIQQKVPLIGLKLYDCAVLYLIMRNLSKEDYDIRLPFILFSFGLFGHGIIIYLVREFEERKLSFLRTLPISLINRFVQYCLMYGIMLTPEILTIIFLTPKFLHFNDALGISVCSYGVLLLLNSITFFTQESVKDFLKIGLAIFFILIFSVFTQTQIWFAVLCTGSAVLLFTSRYLKYEHGSA